jgi:aminoglycoside N3'-acetyltransferase
MGLIPETFRKQNGAIRSNHSQVSFAAWGEYAEEVTQGHGLEQKGQVGLAKTLLVPQRERVDFGVRWLEQNRS